MREVGKEELLRVEGGSSISATMLSAIYKAFQAVYTIGESLGSVLRRLVEGKKCGV